MGVAASVIKDSSRATPIDTNQEALKITCQMAEDQLNGFHEKISTEDPVFQRIPIKKLLNHYKYIHYAASEEEKIGSTIKACAEASVKDFSEGSIVDGLANLAASAITRLLDSPKGTRQMESKYALSVDPLGGILRLDIFFFVYNFESASLVASARSVVAACVVQSAVDTNDIDDVTLRLLVNICFEASELTTREAIYGELYNAMYSDDNEANLFRSRR
ncbi:hypothetical protein MMC16_000830 [Acarospora aff. strigata]|nr:hypothetical protein [Acarospora aff. strigata]